MFPRSIRWRLNLWLAFLLICVLSGFGFTVYHLQRVNQLIAHGRLEDGEEIGRESGLERMRAEGAGSDAETGKQRTEHHENAVHDSAAVSSGRRQPADPGQSQPLYLP